MTGAAADIEITDEWVCCLVLTVAPESHRALVVEAVARAELAVLSDPVRADMARVATTGSAQPLVGGIDDIAYTVRDELLGWALSPARNPAPCVTFGLLVVHPDAAQADRLVRQLSAGGVLAELPVVFRVGRVTPTDLAAPPEPDEIDAVVRMIIAAVDATGAEAGQVKGLAMERDQARALASVPRIEPPVLQAADDRRGVPEETGETQQADRADRSPRFAWPVLLGRLLGAVKGTRRPRRRGDDNVEAVDEVSLRPDDVAILYVVQVSEPVQPRRRDRMRRAAVALELARAVIARPGSTEEPAWYVRAFTADQRLRSARPLPDAQQLRSKDLPQRWAEHLDLYACIDDIRDSLRKDTASFRRRGLTGEPRTVIVLLAGQPPIASDDVAAKVAELSAGAELVWVGCAAEAPDLATKLQAAGMRFVREHEDIVDELVRLVVSYAAPATGPVVDRQDAADAAHDG